MNCKQILSFIPVLFAVHLCAQTTPVFDDSGDAFLSGSYSFRQTYYQPDYSTNSYGTLVRSVAVYGTITFDGNGNYAINGAEVDSTAASASPQAFTTTGVYAIAASGYGYMVNPISQGDYVFGLVSQGIFIGSSTEGLAFNDLFIAAPLGAVPASTAIFNGPYYVSEMDFPTSDPGLSRDALYALNPDGKGNLAGTVTFSGFVANSTTVVNQQVTGATYSLAGGVGTLNFPSDSLSSSVLVEGPKTFYVTPDGSFFFGGSATGFDMLVGVIASSGSVDNSYFNGLYYQAGIDLDSSQITSDQTTLDSYYGSVNAFTGTFLAHERINYLTYPNAFDFTYDDNYNLDSNGNYTAPDGSDDYVVGDGGLIRIGSGNAPYLGISIAVAAPTFTGTGVYLNPTAIVNSASSAPFTASVSPGEFVTLYGTGLAPSSAQNTTLPVANSLNGVQVLVDGIAAPVFYVSPTQVNIAVPYGIVSGVASFQVVNNSSASNVVTEFVSATSAGVFTTAGDGIGPGAVQHLDYALVTDADPAVPGETLITYAAGLGLPTTAIDDGTASPGDPTASSFYVYVDGTQAPITSGDFTGLSGFAALYQINFVVPNVADTGDVYLEVQGPDSDTSQATVAIAGVGAAVTAHKARKSRPRHLPALVPHRTSHAMVSSRYIPIVPRVTK